MREGWDWERREEADVLDLELGLTVMERVEEEAVAGGERVVLAARHGVVRQRQGKEEREVVALVFSLAKMAGTSKDFLQKNVKLPPLSAGAQSSICCRRLNLVPVRFALHNCIAYEVEKKRRGSAGRTGA
jgi:hypothetical protein